MNMTRAILEGIHEVELQVTPEFRKPGKLSVYHVHDLLTSLGWKQEVTDVAVTTEGGDVMVRRTWIHPDMPGVWIVALRRTDRSGSVTVADPNVAEIYAWTADWGVQKIVPNIKDVEDMAKFLAASHGLGKLGAMGQGIHEMELEITPEFQKPKEPEGQLSITVVEELLAHMGWAKGGSTVVSVPNIPGAVQLMLKTKWQYPGMAGTFIALLRQGNVDPDGTFHPGHGISRVYYWRADWGEKEVAPYLDSIEEVASQLVKAYGSTEVVAREKVSSELDQALEAVGWKAVASSATVIVYEHPGVRETIEVTEDKDDNITYANVTFPSGASDPIDPPTIENIVARAEAVKSWKS